MEREIVRYPNRTEPCEECGAEAVRVEEQTDAYTSVGWECGDCGHITPA